MTELLLVGPRQDTVASFQRVLGAQEPDWSVVHSADGESALERLGRRPANIVVGCLEEQSDQETLFAKVAESSPGAIRLAFFDEPPPKVAGAHQTLALRGDAADLHAVLAAAAEVSDRTARDENLKRIISRFQDVPSPPLLYFDIREQMHDASADAASLAEVAGRDPALVARTLRIANSGYYGRPGSIGDLTEAIALIGTDQLLGLVLAAHLFTGLPPPGLRLDVLWQHAMDVSSLASRIGRIEQADRRQLGHCFLAGLLHDIGLMVLLQNEAARYQPMVQSSGGDEGQLAVLEQEAFGITHGELGAVILKLWNLPAEVVDAVSDSHAGATEPEADRRPLAVPSRAVLAAEWLLNAPPPDLEEPPDPLAGTPPSTLSRWLEARQEL